MSKFLSAAASSVVALALATSASAQTAPAAAAPAAPAVTHGPALPGVCIFSSQGAVGNSMVGKAVDARLKTIIQQVNAELTAERTGLDNEAKALDAKKATLAQDALEQQAAALQVKANAWQRKGQLRQKEVETTEQKALQRASERMSQKIHPSTPEINRLRAAAALIPSIESGLLEFKALCRAGCAHGFVLRMDGRECA